jgi:hypothetical protein
MRGVRPSVDSVLFMYQQACVRRVAALECRARGVQQLQALERARNFARCMLQPILRDTPGALRNLLADRTARSTLRDSKQARPRSHRSTFNLQIDQTKCLEFISVLMSRNTVPSVELPESG